MNDINRHNYETFFLLYTDNELSATERKLVEEFVAVNPDLQEELVMLQQSVLKPDNCVFDDKEILLINEIIPAGLQEKLLLHLDNELPGLQENEMAGLIKSDANVRKEWDILQQTRLLPENDIVFRDKRSLYRKESGRVVAFPWLRIAAAAIFIGFGIWGGVVYLNKDSKKASLDIARGGQKSSVEKNAKARTEEIATPVVAPGKKEKEMEAEALATQEADDKTVTPEPIESLKKIQPRKLNKKNIQPDLVLEKDNNLPTPYSENLNKIGSNETIPAYVTDTKQSSKIVNPGNNELDKKAGSEYANMYASATSYPDNEVENNDRIFFMNEEKVKKTKLGGIFRKVKRVFERNANIKPGSNKIKVANLEFAIQ